MNRRSIRNAIYALYAAAREFARQRDLFAPGQYTDFIPLEGDTQHFATHKNLTDAAIAFANSARPSESHGRKFECEIRVDAGRNEFLNSLSMALIMYAVRITSGKYRVVIEKLPKTKDTGAVQGVQLPVRIA